MRDTIPLILPIIIAYVKKPINIAVFHNFMDNIGGAEVVTLTIARAFNADVYTTNINSEHIKQMGFDDVLPRIKSIGKVPIQAPFKHQLSFWRFRRLNLSKSYDFFIISGDWAMSGAVNNKPNLWYVHSPIHEIWDYVEKIKEKFVPWWQKPIYDIWVRINRYLTLKYSKSVDQFVCNSNNTHERIKKYYKNDAVVVNPPIEIPSDVQRKSDIQPYWLSVNRIMVHKRVELQLEAFSKLPSEKLIIVGSYEKGARQFENYKAKLDSMTSENVEFKYWVPKDELEELYRDAKGFITTSETEDFGMTAVEAMANGLPVIAPNEGGYKETILQSETGILIDDINPDKIIDAVTTISDRLSNDPEAYRAKSRERAQKYDSNLFINDLKRLILEKHNIEL